MTFNTVNELNKNFSFRNESSELIFREGPDNIPFVEITNAKASAKISIQGAHVLSWMPHEQADVIWLSEDAKFEKGKSIRGGIPICWPWFGAHVSNNSFPAHGFARTVLWQVVDTKSLSPDETEITFRLSIDQQDEDIQKMWPRDTYVEYRLNISSELNLELITFNNSLESITIGQALHTYFNIEDINNTSVYGLENKTYLDKTDNFNSKVQKGSITIKNEVDRVYLDTPEKVMIDNGKRKIIISKEGSKSSIVWNPWEEVANKMGDLGENGYQKMLCVESANAVNDTVTIKPSESYTMSAKYEIKK